MYNEIKELLFSPHAFFAKKTGPEFNLLIPGAIVLIGGMIGLISPYVVSYFSHYGLEPVNISIPALAFPLYLLGPFVAWFLFSCILYVICKLASGTGTFILTLQNTGYGVLPLTIISTFPLIQGIFLSDFGEIPGTFDLGVMWGVNLLSLLFIFWAGYLWACAMEKTQAISYGKSLVAALIMVLIYLGYHLIVLLGMASRMQS
ncbi:MAG: Yip1 family protein [Methanoregula sp.]|jgi:hypothetical protein